MDQEQPSAAELPPLALPGASDDERHRAIMARKLMRAGRAPTLAEWRKSYALFGREWPGDDEVRRLHAVDDAAS